MGHAFYCCGDEYYEPVTDSTFPQCGHSIMASAEPVAPPPNLSEGDGLVHTVCHSGNHKWDPDPGAAGHPTALTDCNQQAKNAGAIPFVWSRPGDNFAQIDNDFNFAVGDVVTH
jgi:hypothetical protein